MKYIIIRLVLISFIFFYSCKSKEKTSKKITDTIETNDILTAKDYTVISLKDIKTIEKQPTMAIDFSKKLISGNSGCNYYGGEFSVKGNTIKFSDLRATKMYCVKTNHIEKSFFKAISEASTYKIDNTKFLLFNKEGTILLIAERKIDAK